jgi:uncharacterized membrane protein YebE (DUF533 family)
MFDVNQILTALQTDPKMQRNAAMVGAGGLALGLLGGKSARKLMGNAAKYGAVAALGGIAYHAWQKNKAANGSAPATGPATGTTGGQPSGHVIEGTLLPPPTQGPFALPAAEADADALGKALIRAMIAAAKADGKIDPEEKARIFERLNTLNLDPASKAFVFDELGTPLNIDAVIAEAKTPEMAAEIYAASLIAIEDDTPAEKAYLVMLAARLNLEQGLVEEIHRMARA